MIAMLTKCFPNRVTCQIPHCIYCRRGGISESNNQASSGSGPLFGLALVSESRKRGKQLVKAGQTQYAMSYFSKPQGKIWTPYTKKQHRQQYGKGRGVGTLKSHKVSSKKYDYRPGGTSSLAQDRHFRRQPHITGFQPGTGPKATKKHQQRQRMKGGGKIAAGKMLPVLGIGLYGYGLYQSDEPVKEFAKDIAWAYANPVDAAWKASGGEFFWAIFTTPGSGDRAGFNNPQLLYHQQHQSSYASRHRR